MPYYHRNKEEVKVVQDYFKKAFESKKILNGPAKQMNIVVKEMVKALDVERLPATKEVFRIDEEGDSYYIVL